MIRWISPLQDYLALDSDIESRMANYRSLIQKDLDRSLIHEIRSATNGNYALGNNRFKSEVERMLQRRATPGMPGRPSKKS